MTGHLHILNASGHSTVPWDTEKPETVENAEKEFEKLVHSYRHMAFIPGVHGPGERIRRFREEESEIVIVPQMAGGR